MAENFDIYEDITESTSNYADDKKDTEDPSEHSRDERRSESPPRSDLRRQSPVRSDGEGEEMTSDSSGEQVALYIGNLTWWTTDQDLEDLFSPFGKLKSIKFFEDKVNGKSKGYALIEYQNPEISQKAKEALNSKEIYGRPCVINFVSAEGLKQLNRGVSITAIKKRDDKKDPKSSYKGGIKPTGSIGTSSSSGNRSSSSSWSRSSRYPMLPPDPRMLGPFPVPPHINPAFFRDYRDDRDRRYDDRDYRDEHYDRKRDRDERDRDDRDRHREDKDREKRREEDDRKRYKEKEKEKDHKSSKH